MAAKRRKKKRNLTGAALIRFRILMAICAVLICVMTVRNITGAGEKKGKDKTQEDVVLTDESENAQNAADSTPAADGAVLQTTESLDDSTGLAAPLAEDPYADKPDIDINSWEYVLANPWNSISDYVPDVVGIEDIEVDYRIYDAMEAFVADCRAAGNTVYLSSGYRSYDTQSYLFEKKCQEYDEETAATIVARPGTSEHQTGLAADITEEYYEYKSAILEDTAMYQWMEAHCQDYGFIVRFPKGKEDITGIIYEPWHFRYVGVEAATYIMEHNLTLEEFVALYQDDAEASAGDSEDSDEDAGTSDASDETAFAAESSDTDL